MVVRKIHKCVPTAKNLHLVFPTKYIHSVP